MLVFTSFEHMTRGERAMLYSYFMTALYGAALCFVTVAGIAHLNGFLVPRSIFHIWVLVAGALGACYGLKACLSWLGHDGVRGWLGAAAGTLIIAFVAAIIAGTLVLPLYGTMFGPFTLLIAIIERPFIAVLWVAGFARVHLWVLEWRHERDSIFRERPREVSSA